MQETEIEKFILSREKAEVTAKVKQAVAKSKKSKVPKAEQDKIKQKIHQQYIENWVERQLSLDVSSLSSFIPTKQQTALFDFLKLRFSGRITVKQAFDNKLLKLQEHIDKHYPNKFIEWQTEIAKINSELIACYSFFQEQLTKDKQALNANNVVALIDEVAKKAKSGTVASHIGKFTHPTVKEPNLLIDKPYAPDGYLRTGNAPAELDLHINAAYLVVYRFLSLTIAEKSIVQHLLKGNNEIWASFSDNQQKWQQWQAAFDTCLHSQSANTNQLIKQVYFPVGNNNYHLLSVLNPSGLMFTLKERIDYLRYSDQSILGRRYRNSREHFEQGFASLPNITRQRFGGDHPKNISGLNNKHQDVLLLDSSPPQLTSNKNLVIKKDFYQECLWPKAFQYQFYLIHHVLVAELATSPQERSAIITKVLKQEHSYFQQLDNLSDANLQKGVQPHHLKRLLKLLFNSIIDKIVEKIWQIRVDIQANEQYNASLMINKNQQLLLLLDNKKARKASSEWFEDFSSQVSSFVYSSYKNQLKNKYIAFQNEHLHLLNQALKSSKRGLV